MMLAMHDAPLKKATAKRHDKLEVFTHHFTRFVGTGAGLLTALLTLACWFAWGDFQGFSSRWESAVQIYIGVITFLMIFLFQRAQHKEVAALHIKLNALIATSEADNKYIVAEELSEKQITEMHDSHRKIADIPAAAKPQSAAPTDH